MPTGQLTDREWLPGEHLNGLEFPVVFRYQNSCFFLVRTSVAHCMHPWGPYIALHMGPQTAAFLRYLTYIHTQPRSPPHSLPHIPLSNHYPGAHNLGLWAPALS